MVYRWILFFLCFAMCLHTTSSPVEHGNNTLQGGTITSNYYKKPEGAQSVSRVRDLWPRQSGQIHIRNGPNKLTNSDRSSQLQIATNNTHSDVRRFLKLGLGERVMLRFHPYNNAYTLLYLKAKVTFEDSKGFHVKISQTNLDVQVTYTPTLEFITPQGTNGIFKYPSGGRSQHGTYEVALLIGRVPDGKFLNWYLICDMLENDDFAFISWLDYSARLKYRWSGNGTIINGLSIPEVSGHVLTSISTMAVIRVNFNSMIHTLTIEFKVVG